MSITRYVGDRFVGNSSDPFPMSVKDGGEFFQQDSKTIYLKISGVWTPIAGSGTAGSFSGFADPTASVALTVVPGTATTAMRSDAAPPISQSIAPNWTNFHKFNSSSISTSMATPHVQLLNTGEATSSGIRNSPAIVFQGKAWDYRVEPTGSSQTQTCYVGLAMQSLSGEAMRGIFHVGPSVVAKNHSLFTAPFTMSANGNSGLSNFVVGYTGFPLDVHQNYGYLYIKCVSGVPTGTPYNEGLYHVPLTFDSVNNHVYFYNNGWKNVSSSGSSSIVNGITGSGTTNYIPIWVSNSGIANSQIVYTANEYFNYQLNDVFARNRIINLFGVTFGVTGDPGAFTTTTSAGEWLRITSANDGDPYSNKFGLAAPTATLAQGRLRLISWQSGSGVFPANSGLNRFNADFVLGSGRFLAAFYDGTYWRERWRYPQHQSHQLGSNQLTNGTCIISMSGLYSSSKPFVSYTSGVGTLGSLVSFVSGNNLVVYSTSATDNSVFNWVIHENNV